MRSSSHVAVAAGVLIDASGRILVCQRPEGRPYALRWEFPGGKLEPGENAREALARELFEELEVTPLQAEHLHCQRAEYPDGGRFRVDFFIVRSWSGIVRNRRFRQIRWIEPMELRSLDLLEGSRPAAECLLAGRGGSTGFSASSLT